MKVVKFGPRKVIVTKRGLVLIYIPKIYAPLLEGKKVNVTLEVIDVDE